MKDNISNWIVAALIRAGKTAAQTAVAMIPVGLAAYEVSWATVCGTALLAAIVSMLTSIAGIPEISNGDNLIKIAADEDGGDLR